MEGVDRVEVLAFDVFGTVVDWHGSIAREVDALGGSPASERLHLARTDRDGACERRHAGIGLGSVELSLGGVAA